MYLAIVIGFKLTFLFACLTDKGILSIGPRLLIVYYLQNNGRLYFCTFYHNDVQLLLLAVISEGEMQLRVDDGAACSHALLWFGSDRVVIGAT